MVFACLAVIYTVVESRLSSSMCEYLACAMREKSTSTIYDNIICTLYTRLYECVCEESAYDGIKKRTSS